MYGIIVSLFYSAYYSVKWVILRIFTDGRTDSVACLIGKTAIVTGGNSGIGFALSTLLASRGCRVIIADVVDAEKSKQTIIETTGNTNIITKHLDLASLDAVRTFATEIKRDEPKIDILVNNAGVGASIENSTKDGLNAVMQINFLGSFLLTHLLLEPLKSAGSARVIFAGSFMAYFSKLTLDNLEVSFNPLDYKLTVPIGFMLYQNSKLCNIIAAQEFAKKLRKYNIFVNSSDPGVVRTKLIYTANQFYEGWTGEIVRRFKLLQILFHFYGEDEFGGAQTTFHLACSEKLKEETEQHYYRCSRFNKPKLLENSKFCNAVWTKCEELVRLKSEEKL